MAPPELAADAPGLDVAHPGEEGVLPLPRHEPYPALLHRPDRRAGQAGGVAVPLRGQTRLDHGAAALGMRHRMSVGLDLVEQAEPFELGHDRRAGSLARLAGEPTHEDRVGQVGHRRQLGLDVVERHAGIGVEDRGHRQPVPLADREVVEVVRRRDLDGTGALLRVGVGVGDDRDAPAGQRQHHRAADQIGMAGVVGIHRNGGVAQHGLRPRGGDDDAAPVLAVQRIADVPQVAAQLAALHLEVGDRRAEGRVPVHQPLGADDQPLPVQRDEGLAYRRRQALVHGEALARPIERDAEALQLPGDAAAGLRLPGPDALDEGVAAELGSTDALGVELPLDHQLGGDAGMVGAGLPQRVAALHAAPADQDVLQRHRQRVADMQRAGDVRRRDHDGVGRGIATGPGGERARLLPERVETRLGVAWGEILVQHAVMLEKPSGRGKPSRRMLQPHRDHAYGPGLVRRDGPAARSPGAPAARPSVAGWRRARA